jgi:hypothetical protein
LQSSDSHSSTVDRFENIIGSGKTHQRYLPMALSFLKRQLPFDAVVDLGCGDAEFLKEVLLKFSDTKTMGIDLSDIAVKTAHERLSEKFPSDKFAFICANAARIDQWGPPLKSFAGSGRVVIAMWFLLHEISEYHSERVIELITNIHQNFPEASLLIVEIVRQESALLSEHRSHSIMPEYLFFHDISNQGVLSWNEFHEILNKIPYNLKFERVFDQIENGQGDFEPSSFVWGLTPKNERY